MMRAMSAAPPPPKPAAAKAAARRARPAPPLPDEPAQALRFGKARSARSTALLEDYVELISDLLVTHGEARATDIARRLGISHATVVKNVGRLKREGLVTARPSPSAGPFGQAPVQVPASASVFAASPPTQSQQPPAPSETKPSRPPGTARSASGGRSAGFRASTRQRAPSGSSR